MKGKGYIVASAYVGSLAETKGACNQTIMDTSAKNIKIRQLEQPIEIPCTFFSTSIPSCAKSLFPGGILMAVATTRMANKTLEQIYRFAWGDLQPDCSADWPVTGPCQST
eukprot:1139574-Pelagomonas_calceolata.AAC.11